MGKLVEEGVNKLTGNDREKIIAYTTEMLDKQSDFSTNLYGNGKATENIANFLVKDFRR
jgi:UDP-GlcNAc3NAcA epimerase